MFRPKEELYQSGLKYKGFWKPPFDTKEKGKALGDWKKGSNTLLGEKNEGRKMYIVRRQVGEECLDKQLLGHDDRLGHGHIHKLARHKAWHQETTFAGLDLVGAVKNEEGAGHATSATEAITQMRTMFCNHPFGTQDAGLEPLGKKLIEMHRRALQKDFLYCTAKRP